MKNTRTTIFLWAFFCITVFTIPALSHTKETVNCDLDKSLISIKEDSSPLTDIFSHIEKQSNYTIQVIPPNALTGKKTIELNEHPLNLTINRLLSSHNYSIICNEAEKSLLIVLLAEGRVGESVQIKQLSSTKYSMAGAAQSLKSYKKGKRTTSTLPVALDHNDIMAGVTQSQNDYNSGKGTTIDPPSAYTPDNDLMAEVTQSQNDYNEGKRTIIDPPSAYNPDNDSMAGVTQSQNDYNSGKRTTINSSASDTLSNDTMAGVTQSQNDYNGGQRTTIETTTGK